MADEIGLHPMLAVKRIFKGEDDKHAVDIAPYPVDAVLFPRPELRTDKIDDRDAEVVQGPGQREGYIREVDEYGPVRPFGGDAGLELGVFAIDAGDVPDDLGDAHDGDIFGAHDATKAERFHALAAEAEELGVRGELPDGRDELGSVVFSAGLT